MSEAQPTCRLIIALQADDGAPARLNAALGAAATASVIILPPREGPLTPDLARPLVQAAQKTGAAALVVDDWSLARALAADGVHLSQGADADTFRAARSALGNGGIVGADAGRSRDAAMRLGESGADYIGFGIPPSVGDRESARARQLDLIKWWAEIFELPCVALDVEEQTHAEALAHAGADFVAIRLDAASSAERAAEFAAGMLSAICAPVSS